MTVAAIKKTATVMNMNMKEKEKHTGELLLLSADVAASFFFF
mgnify:CR=1 FL=1